MDPIKNEEGFTLLEIVISLVILLILVIAFSGGIINSFRTETRVDQRLETIRVTNSITESLRANKKDFDTIDNNFWGKIENDINDDTNYSIGSNNDFDIEITHSKDGNLYLFQIEWTNRNYSTEVLLAGDE
ncbi:prepilin-type N-terminal cleavage/methylation domain-containing protein [Halanaerobium saccharolyticum]|uniref:Prepilin-type N-terminal cleavage/methylation domain-containing protein n=1 Tax=Halanaerobium saccharolyticum TaxID=43595 RepID=A0A4R6SAC7_9FIRM|nr:type II secretion system protein [Halanaerobium saccharolyticum]TDP96959.1 prepilin-type N-terminal cleavage/methylation domain-containing protein [Halanaerobium saccharolyticum]